MYIFKVKYVQMRNPRNQEIFRRVRLETPNWVNIVAITPKDQIVTVQQYRFGVERVVEEIPGGVIDPGEYHEKAAKRELLEETGYISQEWAYLGWVDVNPATHNNVCHHWLARNAVKANEQALENGEDISIQLRTIAELQAAIQEKRLNHSLALSALSRVFDRTVLFHLNEQS